MELNNLLAILNESLNNKLNKDMIKIQYFYNELKKTNNKLPTIEKLEELQKIEIELETEYEEFYELHNYFDPYYILIKRKIHDENIKKIRENNKRKRSEKINV